ncbi:MAG TPA: TonB-dependent receptor [Woeseiaceae bacterium]|nr:TonB-dependent receptor [Woeseiaceae bacterium]
MRVDENRAVLARVLGPIAALFASFCLLAAPAVYAQDGDEDSIDEFDAIEESDKAVEEVVVTGSRLKRDTYSSIAPLQIITGQMSRAVGAIDPSVILQESTAASGVQVDLTFTGFVLDNGPGTSTVDLRGLGGTRTLVLVNGRRLAPAGVEGAPVSPDLNLIPSALVQQYEILLDGASAVYGSDAIAGVANVILRKDFDGLEFEVYSSLPNGGGTSAGVSNTLSAAWGHNGDRGFFGIGAEYTEADAVTYDDREWTAGCDVHMEEDENGAVRNDGQFYNVLYGMRIDPCRVTGFTRRAWYDGVQELGGSMLGSLYYTAGTSNIGIPNLSEANILDYALDQNQDGMPDIDFGDYNVNGSQQDGHLYPDRSRLNIMSYGEYTFSGEANLTPYYEASYSRSEVENFSGGSLFGGTSQLVPGSNPWNPCNPNGINGVDCGVAYDNLLDDPVFAAGFAQIYGGTPAQYRASGLDFYSGPLGPTAIGANFTIPGERDFYEVEIDQIRVVGGLRGDLPFLTAGSLEDWSFDFAVQQTESSGTSRRGGISEPTLQYSLDTSRFSVPGDPTSPVICGNNDGCVPINLFAPSLYQGLSPRDNDFATQAERDYVMVDRLFTTDYTQSIATYYMTGDLFQLPAGTVLAGFGLEYRKDEIDSIPNDVAANGELWGYFSDKGAVGDKSTKEFFAELELPLLVDVPGFKELTVNMSTRYTKDEFYSGAWTYSGKLAWRPVESLLIRGTVGTSYRAPNLQELFMLGQSGFRNSTFDPCAAGDAFDPITGYDPNQDQRDPWVLDNCRADGVDPETHGGGAQFFSQEVFKTGSFNLEEEKSDSFTAGLTWEQPFFTEFDLSIAATYYQIEVRDEIVRLINQYSINDCYNDIEGDSILCDTFTRDPVTNNLDFADEIFLNRDSLKTRGVDLNIAFDWPTELFGRAVDIGADLAFNRKFQLETRFVNPNTFAVDRFDYVGDFGTPEWEGMSTFRAEFGDYRVTVATRYMASVFAPPLEAFNNIWDSANGDTCLGPSFDDVNCRDISYADNYFRHDLSLYYLGDAWTFGIGLRNVLDEAPPQVDSNTNITSFNNTPVGAGYDLFGRTLFLNVQARFE